MIAPPYPPDTRARGWRFEIDHERIRQSDTWALAGPDIRPWLLMLWLVAWEQTPCGSLPNDDSLIAARIGMAARAFTKHKDVLLRGWVEAEDGRLYHPVVTERVLEMLQYRARSAGRTAKSRATADRAHVGNADVTRYTPVTNGSATGASPVDLSPDLEAKSAVRTEKSRVPAEESCLGNAYVTRYTPVANVVDVTRDTPVTNGSATGESPVGLPPEPEPIPKPKAKPKPFCTEPADAVSVPPADVFLTLPLVGNVEHPITATDVAFWRGTYPAVDIEQSFRSMRAWLTANPTRRKTPRGISRFVMAWLEREQNRGGSRAAKPAGVATATTATQRHEQHRAEGVQWARDMVAAKGGKNAGS